MNPLLTVDDLSKDFPKRVGLLGRTADVIHAVRGVSFSVQRGEILGLVGETGSGKSTTARCIMRLTEPTSGRILLDGQDVLAADRRRLLLLRRRMQMVFQDPYSSLNPRMRVEDIVGEGLIIHKLASSSADRRRRVAELLDLVGLGEEHLRRYPREFSGGQRQRIGIARALAVQPELILCDEPVSSLDVSIAAQIVNMFKDLQERLGLTMLFIAHDLAIVRHLCDRVAVMLDGEIVETGTRDDIYASPQHEYTQSLLNAKAIPDPIIERRRKGARLGAEFQERPEHQPQ